MHILSCHGGSLCSASLLAGSPLIVQQQPPGLCLLLSAYAASALVLIPLLPAHKELILLPQVFRELSPAHSASERSIDASIHIDRAP